MNRRKFGLTVSTLLLSRALPASALSDGSQPTRLAKPRSEWKSLLPGDRYRVLFDEGTEPPFSSALDREKGKGVFVCAACQQPLFDSAHKFDSGTGWPSFWDVLPQAVARKADRNLLIERTEYHCARCGGHQGHVFEDGPAPTHLRYCNNGLALQFIPAGQALPPLRT